jgi:hypothetical protein
MVIRSPNTFNCIKLMIIKDFIDVTEGTKISDFLEIVQWTALIFGCGPI